MDDEIDDFEISPSGEVEQAAKVNFANVACLTAEKDDDDDDVDNFEFAGVHFEMPATGTLAEVTKAMDRKGLVNLDSMLGNDKELQDLWSNRLDKINSQLVTEFWSKRKKARASTTLAFRFRQWFLNLNMLQQFERPPPIAYVRLILSEPFWSECPNLKETELEDAWNEQSLKEKISPCALWSSVFFILCMCMWTFLVLVLGMKFDLEAKTAYVDPTTGGMVDVGKALKDAGAMGANSFIGNVFDTVHSGVQSSIKHAYSLLDAAATEASTTTIGGAEDAEGFDMMSFINFGDKGSAAWLSTITASIFFDTMIKRPLGGLTVLGIFFMFFYGCTTRKVKENYDECAKEMGRLQSEELCRIVLKARFRDPSLQAKLILSALELQEELWKEAHPEVPSSLLAIPQALQLKKKLVAAVNVTAPRKL